MSYLVLSILVLVSLDSAKEPVGHDARANLLILEKKWNEAHLEGNANKLNELWADELIVTVQGMPVMNKAQALGFVRSGLMKFKRYETSDLKINVFGDSAVVTGRLDRVRERQGRVFDDKWRFTKVYVLRDGKWQVVAWHGSQAAK